VYLYFFFQWVAVADKKKLEANKQPSGDSENASNEG
jgi:hypothetical protein